MSLVTFMPTSVIADTAYQSVHCDIFMPISVNADNACQRAVLRATAIVFSQCLQSAVDKAWQYWQKAVNTTSHCYCEQSVS